eukprot:1474558-Prymnesium_polylepis.1
MLAAARLAVAVGGSVWVLMVGEDAAIEVTPAVAAWEAAKVVAQTATATGAEGAREKEGAGEAAMAREAEAAVAAAGEAAVEAAGTVLETLVA